MSNPDQNPPQNAQEASHGVRTSPEDQHGGRKKKRKTKKVSASTWEELKIAYVSGNALRELARKTGIPSGTILSRASREGWGKQIQSAKALAPVEKSHSIVEAVSATRRERGERYQDRMSGIVEGTLLLLERMDPMERLELAAAIDRLDRVGRRSFGLDDLKGDVGSGRPLINLNIRLEDLTRITPLERWDVVEAVDV